VTTAQQMIDQVRRQLREAGESVWQRYPLATDFPSFRNAPRAALNALAAIDRERWMVMRDPSLRPMREAVLAAGRQLIVPTRDGREFLQIPISALSRPYGGRSVLRLSPVPSGSVPYRGAVDVVVVSCHAFEPGRPRLMCLDTCHTAALLSDWREGLLDGWRLGPVLVIALAADAQQVGGWPVTAEGHEADVVVTPTRVVALRTGEQGRLDDVAPNVSPQDPGLHTPVATATLSEVRDGAERLGGPVTNYIAAGPAPQINPER